MLDDRSSKAIKVKLAKAIELIVNNNQKIITQHFVRYN
jgi:hypothetical protein